MLGSGGFIVYNDTSCIVVMELCSFYHQQLDNAPHVVKVQDGWKKYYTRSKTVTDVKDIDDLLWNIQVKEIQFVH
jgi:NADH-quinone oxidoreductase subunit F